MTRENKLALVVGFALFLLVGILISDHFSAARSQQAAEFAGEIDTISESRWDDPKLIAVGPGRIPESESDRPEASQSYREPPPVRAVDPIAGDRRTAIEMGAPPEGRVDLNPSESAALPYTYHEVRENETLTAICNQYYGDISLIEQLAAANGIGDPNSVRAGRRLRIPSAESLVRDRGGAATAPSPGRAPATAQRPDQVYTVREGDNLSAIAQRFLGSANRFNVIFEHNRDVLSSPDDLKPGMKLKIPRSAG